MHLSIDNGTGIVNEPHLPDKPFSRLLTTGLPFATEADPEGKGNQAYIKPEILGVNRDDIS